MTEETGSAAADASTFRPGRSTSARSAGGQIAGYQIEAEIGHGGMAIVYRALDVKLGRRVALKILAPRLAEDESFRQRFIHESRAAAAVDHPNIIPVFEAGESGGVLFIAMRYVGTGDVRTLLERQGRLPVDRAVAICAQVASALDAASARGLVHRDVKPANILLAESAEGRADHVYLSDFGLSKHSLAPSGLTATGQFMGTLDYVAPEQIEGRAVDGRADQYALACAAVEMLTGAPVPARREHRAHVGPALGVPALPARAAARPARGHRPGHLQGAGQGPGRPVPDLHGLRRGAGAASVAGPAGWPALARSGADADRAGPPPGRADPRGSAGSGRGRRPRCPGGPGCSGGSGGSRGAARPVGPGRGSGRC